MQPHLKCVYYDMDGTLVHFLIDYKKARQKAIDELQTQGMVHAQEMFSVNIPWTITLQNARTYMQKILGFSSDKILGILNIVNQKIVEIEREAAINAKKVDNIEQILEFGQQHGIKQVVVTFNTHLVAVLTLETVGLLEYIDLIYGRDDVSHPKPNKAHLQAAADKYHFEPNEAILIGDMHSDILAAHNFGCEAIGIRTDFEINTIEEADYVVDQNNAPFEIIKILKSKFLFG